MRAHTDIPSTFKKTGRPIAIATTFSAHSNPSPTLLLPDRISEQPLDDLGGQRDWCDVEERVTLPYTARLEVGIEGVGRERVEEN